LASILRDLIISKYEVDPSWQKKIKDIENVMQHTLNRRYGIPVKDD